jgi:glycerol-3-phosphate dehydrogenase
VGCAIARELSRHELSVVLVEKQDDVGSVTSKANTAILHTGFDTVPGSLESALVTEGYRQLASYARAAGIAVEATGALLVAWDQEQEAALAALQSKAVANGVTTTSQLEASEVRRREPHLAAGARSGLEVPGESIIDPWSVTLAFATEAVRNGVVLLRSTEVNGVVDDVDHYRLSTSRGELRARWIVNAAGLSSDTINRLFSHDEFSITPRRGQLIVFDKFARALVNEILLPVPTERTKGVLISPTVWGNVLLGPTAEDLDDRTDTSSTREGIDQLLSAGRRLLPSLLEEEVTAIYSGLRAATEHRDYQIRLDAAQRYVCVGGIRSTGLTGSMAIATHVVGLIRNAGELLQPKENPCATPRMAPLGEQQIRPLQDDALIENDSQYGMAVCHCEQVSRGELRDVFVSTVAPVSIEGVRRRTRAMNGRCQGFYCGADVTEVIVTATGFSVEHLTRLEAES